MRAKSKKQDSNKWADDPKRYSIGDDSSEKFLDFFKMEIDNTKTDLSKTLYKLEVDANSNVQDNFAHLLGTDYYDLPDDVNELPDLDPADYIREKTDGFEVYDGTRWHHVSKEANIQLDVFQNPEDNNRTAAKLWVLDDNTQTSILYIDKDIKAVGYDLALTNIGDGYEQYKEMFFKERNYIDPFLNLTKKAAGFAGRSAGALALRQIGNFSPWYKGDALRNADGWFRNKEGIYQQLSKQRGIGGGGYQKSAKRALGKAKGFKNIGRKFFYVGAAIGISEAVYAYAKDDAKKEEVAVKATFDIVFGAIGVFGGPVGWVISGTYFLFDIAGGWGDYGQPMGMSNTELNTFMQHTYEDLSKRFKYKKSELDFEIDYCPSNELYIEERLIPRDNTSVAPPKIIFPKY